MPPVQPFDDLITANEAYAEAFAHGTLPAPPSRQLAIVTCMDSRIDAYRIFGLQPGEAHVLRNAGARATDDMVRSLVKSTNQLGVTRIAVVHHTGCGAAKIKLPTLRQCVQDNTGHDPAEVEFHLIDDEDQSIVDDVEAFAACPYFPPGTMVGGFLYDVATGRLDPRLVREVVGTPTTTAN